MKKNLKLWLLLILVILVTTPCTSQDNSSKKNFLWQIESYKGKVYLLGSMHLAKKDLFPLDNVIENAFAESDYLVVEVDASKINQQKILEMAMYSDKTKLEDKVSKETFSKLKDLFEKHEVPPAFYNRMKPWFAITFLVAQELKSEGYDQEGIDMHFLKTAKTKPILELESMYEQIELLSSFDTEPDKFIEYSLKDFSVSVKMVDSLTTAWKNGDSEEMNRLLNASLDDKEFEDLKYKMFDERNIKMKDKIVDYLKADKIYFVVVGAGHIVGEKGILELLKKEKKYIIKQL